MLLLFLCAFNLLSPALADEVLLEGLNCPADWLYSNGSCYRAYSTKLSWFDAAKFCRENKGELVSINSEGEQRFVYQSMAVNKTLWIGLVKDSGLQRFRWSTGEKLTYQNWIRGEGSISGHEDCGEMTDYSIFRGQWNDNSCSAKQTYICEKDARSGRYFKRLLKRKLTGHMINRMTTSSDMECLLLCHRHEQCVSINYKPGESTSVCELNAVIAEDFPEDLTDSNDFDYYESFV